MGDDNNEQRRRQGDNNLDGLPLADAAHAAPAAPRAAVPVAVIPGRDAQQQQPPEAGGDGDDDDDDDINELVHDFRDAADLLEDGTERPIGTLVLEAGEGDPTTRDNDDRDLRFGFPRFVTALRRNARAVRGMEFFDVDWQATPEDDTVQLLGEVLPSHPTLEGITFFACHFSSAHQLELFTSSVPTTATRRLAKLEFQCIPVDCEVAQAIADVVRRDVTITELMVDPGEGHGLAANAFQRLFQAALGNKNIRTFTTRVKELVDGTLENAVGASSSLDQLEVFVDGAFSANAVAKLARELRTNTTMTTLSLLRDERVKPHADESPDLFRPFEDVLETYNFTLEAVYVAHSHLPAQERIDALLRRNAQIYTKLWELQRSDSSGRARDKPQILQRITPRLLAAAGCLPTLLYRYLRRGDANDWCRLVLQNKGSAKKKRGRASTG